MRRLFSLPALFAGALFFFAGCTNRGLNRVEKFGNLLDKDPGVAAQTVSKKKDLYGNDDRFLYYMDVGLLYHYARKYDSSNLFLEKAVQTLDDLYAKSLTNEAAALVTNDNIRPYRSKPYEILYLHQFMAFNWLALGKNDAALVETRRAQLWNDKWEKEMKDKEKWAQDGLFPYMSSIAYLNNSEQDNSSIALYNSIKSYKKGVISLPAAVRDQAFYSFQRNNRLNDIQDLNLKAHENSEQIAKPDQSEIVLVAYAGKAPVLGETMFWGTWIKDGLLIIHYRDENGRTVTQTLPAPGLAASEQNKARRGRKTNSGTTFNIKWTMPSLKTRPHVTAGFNLEVNGFGNKNTEALSNSDLLLRQHLEDNYTSTLTRTVVRVLGRTITQQATKSALKTDNPLINLVVNLGTDFLAGELEQSDTRTCFFLPRNIHATRIIVEPGRHQVRVTAMDKNGKELSNQEIKDVVVEKGERKILFYSSFK